ncbi:MAG: YjbQ family protein [Deltaproteobacteria bacterium]|nr:YjbQ family protein [Deltaproteobacteria bacterium]
MEKISVTTGKRIQLIDITDKIRDIVHKNGWKDGAVLLFIPHTTAGITINEGADPDVRRDIEETLAQLIPYRGNYRHAEGNSDAHIKTTLTGNSSFVILENGNLKLGTWQSIFFCEYDGPRNRNLWIQHLEE